MIGASHRDSMNGRAFRAGLLLGTGLALSLPISVMAQPVDEVTVTGSRIRGVAPVGSTMTAVSTQDVAKTGAVTPAEMLKKLPQISNAGASDNLVGGASVGFRSQQTTFQNSVNLRGLGPSATLSLLSGQRLAPSSIGQQGFDSDTIPFLALSRVEIVADGASAIYGADAIAGVANFILKDPEDVNISSGQAAFGDGTRRWFAAQQLGKTWDLDGLGEGGLILTYQHSHNDGLYTADRASIFNDNLVPFGGPPSTTVANPGNILNLGGVPAGTPVPVATGTAPAPFVTTAPATPLGITLANLGTAGSPNRQNQWENVLVYPKTKRDSVVGHFKQRLTDWLEIYAHGFYGRYHFKGTNPPPPAVAALNVPATNPYSPCAAGKPAANSQGLTCPAGGTLSVAYNFVNDIGAVIRSGTSTRFGYTGGLVFDLGHEWSATLSGSYSSEDDNTANSAQLNNAALTQVVTGVGKPTNIPFFNPFCDPRTYQGGSARPCNDPLTIAYFSGVSYNAHTNNLFDYAINADGPVFDLPGGTVRLSVGMEHYWQRLLLKTSSTTGPAGVGVVVVNNVGGVPAIQRRRDTAFYAEAYIPLVGEANAFSLAKKLEFTAAVRTEDYSDFGRTTNPKFGVNWVPVDGVKIHGSYGTSFHAPDIHRTIPSGAAGFLVNPALTVASFAGQATGAPATAVTALAEIGGTAGLGPETANTWSVGFDFTPEQWAGFNLSLNYYNVHYKNRINTPSFNAGYVGAVTTGLYDQFLVLNPTYFPTRAVVTPPARQYAATSGLTLGAPLTQAQFNAFYAAVLTDPVHPVLGVAPPTTASVAYVMDARNYNSEMIETDGIDFEAGYQRDYDLGTVHATLTGTYVLTFAYAPIAGAPLDDNVNVFGYPPRLRGRLELGWERGGWSVTGFANYTNSYKLWNDSSPITRLVPFLPAGSPYQNIDSYTTFDLSVGYDTGDSLGVMLLRNLRLNLVAQNIFDQGPPLVVNAGSTPAMLYDPQNASALGRIISIQVTKRW